VNRSRNVGTTAETAAVEYLRAWWPHCERRAQHGNTDRGDIAGIPGLVVEVKAVVKSGYEIPAWMRETEVERVNAGVPLSLLIVKPKGVARAENFWAVMPIRQACGLLADPT
jgi:hypothetical protein